MTTSSVTIGADDRFIRSKTGSDSVILARLMNKRSHGKINKYGQFKSLETNKHFIGESPPTKLVLMSCH